MLYNNSSSSRAVRVTCTCARPAQTGTAAYAASLLFTAGFAG